MIQPARLEPDSPLAQFFRDTSGSVVLNKTDERHLLYLAQIGESKAAQKLAFANLRLVITIVSAFFKKYQPHRSKPESLFLDCVMAGVEGVYKAAGKFDITKGTKFSTYVVWWIKHYVRSELVFDRNATQPIRVLTDMSKIQTAIVDHDSVPDLADTYVARDLPAEDVDYDTPKITWEMVELLETCEELSSKHRKILTEHYGLYNVNPKTYKALAQEMGLTTERVRQLENEALRILYLKMSKPAFNRLEDTFEEHGCLV